MGFPRSNQSYSYYNSQYKRRGRARTTTRHQRRARGRGRTIEQGKGHKNQHYNPYISQQPQEENEYVTKSMSMAEIRKEMADSPIPSQNPPSPPSAASSGHRNYQSRAQRENIYITKTKSWAEIQKEMNELSPSPPPAPNTDTHSTLPTLPSSPSTSYDNEVHENIVSESNDYNPFVTETMTMTQINQEIEKEPEPLAVPSTIISPNQSPSSSTLLSDNQVTDHIISEPEPKSEDIDISAIVAGIQLKYEQEKEKKKAKERKRKRQETQPEFIRHTVKHKTAQKNNNNGYHPSLTSIAENNEYHKNDNDWNDIKEDQDDMDQAAYNDFLNETDELVLKDAEQSLLSQRIAEVDDDGSAVGYVKADDMKGKIQLTDKNVGVLTKGDMVVKLNTENGWDGFLFDYIHTRDKIAYFKTTDGKDSMWKWICDLKKEKMFIANKKTDNNGITYEWRPDFDYKDRIIIDENGIFWKCVGDNLEDKYYDPLTSWAKLLNVRTKEKKEVYLNRMAHKLPSW